MPSRPPRACEQPGCQTLAHHGFYCAAHTRVSQRAFDRQRGSAASRGYNGRWRKARETFLYQHPLCCTKAGALGLEHDCNEPALIVDHIVPHRGDQSLFWDSSNWQPLCKRCHDVKTSTVDRDGGGGLKV